MTRDDAVVTLQNAFWLAGEHLLYYYTNPWELDEALCDWGYTMGPCEAQDLVGLEKVLARVPDRNVPILPRMVAEGRMGKGGGVGYYRYPGGGGAVIDPLIEDLILEEAWFGKVTRAELSDAALVAHMNAAVIEAVRAAGLAGLTQNELAELLQRSLHFPPERAASFLS